MGTTEDEIIFNDAESPVTEEKSPIAEKSPVVEKSPLVETSPIVEETPVVEEVPVVVESPVVKDTLSVGEIKNAETSSIEHNVEDEVDENSNTDAEIAVENG